MSVGYQWTTTGGVNGTTYRNVNTSGINIGTFSGAAAPRGFQSNYLSTRSLAAPVQTSSFVLIEVAGGPATYEKEGSLVAGTQVYGADVAEHVETGALTTRALSSGADSFQPAETGSLTTRAELRGADVFNANETGTTPVGTLLSGVSEYIPSGPAAYEKTGSLTTRAMSSGIDSEERVEAGALLAGTKLAGPDAFTAVESGSLTVGTVLAGGDASTVNRLGALIAGTLLAGVAVKAGLEAPGFSGYFDDDTEYGRTAQRERDADFLPVLTGRSRARVQNRGFTSVQSGKIESD